MKDREEYISILEQDNAELKKQVDELNRFKFSCKKDETRIPATIYSKKTVEDLIKGNQELKKQLEEINKMIGKCGFANIEQVMLNYCGLLNQQKEFIKYLEDEKDRLIKETSHYYIDSFDRQHAVNETIYDEVDIILQKYKSIIGE